MRRLALFLLLISPGLLNAQDEQPVLRVRAVAVRVISTSPEGLPTVEFQAIREAWARNKVNLAVENRFDVASIDKAEEVIREVYRSAGHEVRVEHSTRQMPPRGVEIAFQVIELCRCN